MCLVWPISKQAGTAGLVGRLGGKEAMQQPSQIDEMINLCVKARLIVSATHSGSQQGEPTRAALAPLPPAAMQLPGGSSVAVRKRSQS
jgi:hypothetical protein